MGETLVDAMSDAVIAIDRAHRITYANAAAERLIGAAIGGDLRELVGDGPWSRAELGDACARSEALVHLRGVPRIVADTTSPLPDGGTVVVMRDVTDYVVARRSAALDDQTAAASSANAALAHQVNNPLAVILVHAEFVRDELARLADQHPDEAARIAEALGSQLELERAAATIGALMADLRTFSQPTGTAGSADAQRAVDYAVRTATAKARDRARLFTHVELGDPIAIADGSLAELLVHLLANAAAAIAPGAADRHEIHVTARRDGAHAVLEIRDTGSGMTGTPMLAPAADRVHVGLGLVRCRAILDAVGGSLGFEPAPGGGTIARATLPLAHTAPAKARVLVVDGDSAYLRGLRRQLRDHDVTACATAAEALAHLARDARYDLVIADIAAPELAGRALYLGVLAAHPALASRIVFTVEAGDEGAVGDFLATTPNPRLEKPIAPSMLRALLER